MKIILALLCIAIVFESRADNQPAQSDALTKYLSEMPQNELCLVYGRALRGEKIRQKRLGFKGASQKVIDFVHKITLNMEDNSIKNKTIHLKMNICNMYAAWGLPEDENRSVGSFGVHIQHIYPGTYVYTENGVITSYQD